MWFRIYILLHRSNWNRTWQYMGAWNCTKKLITLNCRIPRSTAKLFQKLFCFINCSHFLCHANLDTTKTPSVLCEWEMKLRTHQVPSKFDNCNTSYLCVIIISKKFSFLQPKTQNLVNYWSIIEISTGGTGNISTKNFFTQRSVLCMLQNRAIAWTIQCKYPRPIFCCSIFVPLPW